ncbi:MAG: VTT domain-containing protein [Syntrophorhabdaceae bacterium]|nr:VTT domain-containing protein [Syntrophorhabdaceae bacterium]
MGGIGFFFDRERIIGFLDSLGPWSFAGFIFLQIIQVVAAPIPGEITGVLGGFLYGPLIGILLSTIGLTAGSMIAFQISRVLGRPTVEHMVDPRIMKRFDFLLHHRGAFLVFLLFLLPGFPKDYLCYVLGLGRLSLFEFTAISATARVLGTVILTFGGAFLRQKRYMELSLLTAAAVAFVVLVLLYKNSLERWFRALHEKNTNPDI